MAGGFIRETLAQLTHKAAEFHLHSRDGTCEDHAGLTVVERWDLTMQYDVDVVQPRIC